MASRSGEEIFMEMDTELVDDFAIPRCWKCGSRNITPEGVCLLCSSRQSTREVKPPKTERRVSRLEDRRERIAMYLGIALIIVGGPGIVSMSYLHDWLKIPVPGPAFDTYDAFGPVNSFVAMVGLAITLIGILFLVASLAVGKGAERVQPSEVH